MEVYTHLEYMHDSSAIALGFFDGVHIAHTEVIKKNLSYPGLVSTVLTFSSKNGLPGNKSDSKLILTDEQKIERFKALGVKRVFLPKFSEISSLPAQTFLEDILNNRLHAAMISCGYDYTFGNGAVGSASMIEKFCNTNKIAFSVLPAYVKDDCLVSSSTIRKYLLEGNIKAANDMLGYTYDILGKVVSGRHLGNSLGFPTVNQVFSESQLVPKYGVYKSITQFENKEYKSITNIGIKPTIPGKRIPLAETHIIGAYGDFYGKTIRVSLLSLMRKEQKFANIEELRETVLHDIKNR